MVNRVPAATFLATAIAGLLGCSGDPPPNPVDSGMDVRDGAEVSSPDVAPDITQGDTHDGAVCPSVDFTTLRMNQTLGIAEDLNRNCSDGFATNVQIATNAQVGTMLELVVNSRTAGTARVTSPVVLFSNVTLDTGSPSTIAVRVANALQSCQSVTVQVDCNTPRCQVTRPTRSVLNRADGVSGAMAFAVDFTVSSDIEDGREVLLNVSSRPTPLRATVTGGTATFRAVPLAPDGDHRVRATCTNAAGNTGSSAESSFTVDATPPSLTVISPMEGTTVGISSDVNTTLDGVQFRVCARSDAAGQSLCAAVGSGMPDVPRGCSTVPTTAMMDGCVEVTCPTGSAPFDVTVATQDSVGNPTRATLSGVRCQSALPSVRVLSPAAYTPGMDATILNALRDENPATPGLQTTVVACSDRPEGSARLLVNGVALGVPAALTPTSAGDPCAMLGMGFVSIVRYVGVTLPQTSPERSSSTDAQPGSPSIVVEVTDLARDVGRSPAVPLYIDSIPPDVTILSCNRVVTLVAGTSVTTDIEVLSITFPVTLTLRHEMDTPTTLTAMAPSTPGRARYTAVRLLAGNTALSTTATDPAGNVGVFPASGASCNLNVGNPPNLGFVSPTPAQIFPRAGDPDPLMAGFQGVTVRLLSDAPVGTVITLTVGSEAPRTAMVAAGATVSFGPLTLPESPGLLLTATTAEVAGRGIGRASVTVLVDTVSPENATGLTLNVPSAERRAGTVRLGFANGSDAVPGGMPAAVARYEVRYGGAPIEASNFAIALLASMSATAGAPGTAGFYDLQRLRLGVRYYVALRAFDAAGNPSGVTSVGPITPDLIIDRVVSMSAGAVTGVSIGRSVTGGFDTNGDMFSDVVTGSNIGYVRLLFGSAAGVTGATSSDIIGPTAALNGFGITAASVGDINGDGLGDVLVGHGASRVAYLYFGRRAWPATQGPADASVTLTAGSSDLAGSNFAQIVTRVGDFNGDGLNDFSISAPGPNLSDTTSTQPGVVYVYFGRPAGTAWPATLSSDDANVVIRYNIPRGVFGASVAGIGRAVAGDTRDDIAILAGAADMSESSMAFGARRGRALVFAGRAATTQLVLTPADSTVDVLGASPSARISSVGGVGDIDGDGRSDMALGVAPGNGALRLFFGTAAGTGFTEGATLPGAAGTFGSVIATLTDSAQNQPTLLFPGGIGADLLLSEFSHLGSAQPFVYTYIGRPAASWSTATPTNAEYTVVSEGVPGATGTQAITGLNWVGDVDGDGAPDLAFGQSSSGTPNAGRVYIVR